MRDDARAVRIAELSAAQTHDLRRRVLRVGTPDDSVEWVGDELDTTLHLGVVRVAAGGAASTTAISTWLACNSPDVAVAEHEHGLQLRGMATDPSVRGQGHGSLLLRAGIERAAAAGVTHVWANARSSVLDFYEAHGFAVVSAEFDSVETAIAHRRILLRLHQETG